MKISRRSFLNSAALLGVAAPAMNSSFGLPKRAKAQEGQLVVDGLDTSIVNEEFLGLLKAGGVHCMHKSVGDLNTFGALHAFVDAHAGQVMIARSVSEIRAARKEGRISFVCGMQDANVYEAMLTKTPAGTYGPLSTGLRGYYELGLRVQGICYNVANIFGGGCLDHTVPLTRVGQRLVEEIHKLKIILDVGGHSAEQTSLDALEISAGVPVICSHTNVAALNPNPRAASDRLFEAIARTGGVIGLTAISDFHTRSSKSLSAHGPRSPQATLDEHLDQYDHLRRLVGVDHIGLGPDFIWGWGEDYVHTAKDNLTFPTDSMSDGKPRLVQGFEDISKLPNLVQGLRGRGWSKPELDKLLGANWLRVYAAVWGA